MDELTKRNMRAMSEGLKSVRTRNEELEAKQKEYDTKLGQMAHELATLKQQYGILLARFHGNGRTA